MKCNHKWIMNKEKADDYGQAIYTFYCEKCLKFKQKEVTYTNYSSGKIDKVEDI